MAARWSEIWKDFARASTVGESNPGGLHHGPLVGLGGDGEKTPLVSAIT